MLAWRLSAVKAKRPRIQSRHHDSPGVIEAPHHLARAGIPQIGAVIVAAGEGIATIGGEIHRVDLFGVAEELQPASGLGVDHSALPSSRPMSTWRPSAEIAASRRLDSGRE
jgi:hypothetical protein